MLATSIASWCLHSIVRGRNDEGSEGLVAMAYLLINGLSESPSGELAELS